MINISSEQSNNGIIEKYCYDDNSVSCDLAGGLYSWNEMMQYGNTPGSQGICPAGWHIPTDEEWKQFEAAADSQFGTGNPEWNGWGLRGFDAGLNLKSTVGWWNGEKGTGFLNFFALPGGLGLTWNEFRWAGRKAYFWTSESFENNYQAWGRELHYDSNKIQRSPMHINEKRSVRCLKDNL